MEEEAEGAADGGLTVEITLPRPVELDLFYSSCSAYRAEFDLRALWFDGDRTVYSCWA